MLFKLSSMLENKQMNETFKPLGKKLPYSYFAYQTLLKNIQKHFWYKYPG